LAEARRSACVHQQEQLHQVVVWRAAGGLNDEAVAAANILLNLDHHLAVGKMSDVGIAQAGLEMLANFASKRRIGVAGENLEFVFSAFGHC
jgi:hypothetical protein